MSQQPQLNWRNVKLGKIPFVASDKQSLAIPRVNAYRWLSMLFKIVVVENNTANPTEVEDTILNIVKKVKLILDKDDVKFSYDLKKKFYKQKIRKGTEPSNNRNTLLGQNETKTYYVHIRHDFASNPLDQSDISAMLPTKKYSELTLEIEWGALANMFSANTGGTTITAASSGCWVQAREAYFDDKTTNDQFAKGELGNGFLDLREAIQSKKIDKSYGNLENDAFEVPIKPAQVKILNALILTTDTNGLKSNALVTDLSLQDVRGAGIRYITSDFDQFNKSMKDEYQIESLEDGIVYLDFVELLNGGLFNDDSADSIKYMSTTPAPAGTPYFEVLTEYLKGRA